MAAQGRLGDRSYNARDVHSCPACTHSVTGPAVTGSEDVLVNGRPALREGDDGVHTLCCGSNTWQAVKGSSSVLINGRGAFRCGDRSEHCGGRGLLVDGSPDVFVGD